MNDIINLTKAETSVSNNTHEKNIGQQADTESDEKFQLPKRRRRIEPNIGAATRR